MENEKIPNRERMRELLIKTDDKLIETSKELDQDGNMVIALGKLYGAMRKLFVKKKLRRAIKCSETYTNLVYNVNKMATNNKGYEFPTNEMKNAFTDYRIEYSKCFLEMVQDDIRNDAKEDR